MTDTAKQAATPETVCVSSPQGDDGAGGSVPQKLPEQACGGAGLSDNPYRMQGKAVKAIRALAKGSK